MPSPKPHGSGFWPKEMPRRAVVEENTESLTRPAVTPPSEKNHALSCRSARAASGWLNVIGAVAALVA